MRDGCRFGYDVAVAALSFCGCPKASLIGKDDHSDREAVRMMNPKFTGLDVFDDFGVVILQTPRLNEDICEYLSILVFVFSISPVTGPA